jgi:hypothetical protein
MNRNVAAILAGLAVGTSVYVTVSLATRQTPAPPVPQCWAAMTEDSTPHPVPCDYRDGAYWPLTAPLTLPPCDDGAQGTCWLTDDGSVAIWPRPYASTPLLILEGSKP